MPTIFIQWLLLRFASRVLRITFALTVLLAVFDLLTQASEIASEASHSFYALLFYFLLRLPGIAVFILPLGVLIAAVQVFSSLASQREILALEASGFTLSRIVITLLTGAFFLSVGQFVFTDYFVTDTQERLGEWQADHYQGLPKLEALPDSPEWVSSEGFLVQTGGVSPDGHHLQSPTVLAIDSSGVASHYYNAESASYQEVNTGNKQTPPKSSWVLKNAVTRDLRLQSEAYAKAIILPLTLQPKDFASFSKPIEELRFSQLYALGWKDMNSQIHPNAVYQVWAYSRIVQALSCMVMVLLAAPICLQIQRNARRLYVTIAVFALGFFYFILQSILIPLGENGTFPPVVAAWATFICFGFLGAAAVFFRVK
ncbi:MAG: LptF/LptG family permease [Chthoniobacterales bacterium]